MAKANKATEANTEAAIVAPKKPRASKPKTDLAKHLDQLAKEPEQAEGIVARVAGPNTVEPVSETTQDVLKAAADAVAEAVKASEQKTVNALIVGEHKYELKDGASAEAVVAASEKARADFLAVKNKDADLIGLYLSLGEFQSSVAGMFSGPKAYGQFLKVELPESSLLDAALRSNCKWLWEALNKVDHEASDILSILGINRIEDFKSQNPTVIRREYKVAKDAKVKAEEAAKIGVDVERLAEIEKEEREAKAKADTEATQVLIRAFVNTIAGEVLTAEQNAAFVVAFEHFAIGKKADALGYLQSMLAPAEAEQKSEPSPVVDPVDF